MRWVSIFYPVFLLGVGQSLQLFWLLFEAAVTFWGSAIVRVGEHPNPYGSFWTALSKEGGERSADAPVRTWPQWFLGVFILLIIACIFLLIATKLHMAGFLSLRPKAL